tara:strand:- start:132 stop:485 length:354 start_codon:yes stop_codon:yes gene_type:complete
MIKLEKIILFIGIVLISTSLYAQKPKYEKANFKVWGNCEMCMVTIEKAAKSVDGVKTARWNMINEKIKVKFDPEKTDLEKIQQAITFVGYDTELFKATDESYNSLHYCCKYERPNEE